MLPNPEKELLHQSWCPPQGTLGSLGDQLPTHCSASSRKLCIFLPTSTAFPYPSQTNSGNKILPWGREGFKMLKPFYEVFSISLSQVQPTPGGWELNYGSQKMEGTIFKTSMGLHLFLSARGGVPPPLTEVWLAAVVPETGLL